VTNTHDNVKRRLSMPGIALSSIALALAVVAAAIGTGTVRAASGAYIVNPLVSDGGTTAPTTDASLVNGWGLSAGPSGTLYFLAGPSGGRHGLLGSITTG
jgi:hypothetical protein